MGQSVRWQVCDKPSKSGPTPIGRSAEKRIDDLDVDARLRSVLPRIADWAISYPAATAEVAATHTMMPAIRMRYSTCAPGGGGDLSPIGNAMSHSRANQSAILIPVSRHLAT